MSTLNSVYLITGANRGIGRALADIFLSRSNTTVIALVRDPNHETSQSLLSSSNQNNYGTNSQAILIPYDASDPSSADKAIEHLNGHNITHLNFAIANAGVAGYFGPTLEATDEDWLDHYKTNTMGPLTLFRACLPLLQASRESQRKGTFVAISSAAGSTSFVPMQSLAVDVHGKPQRSAIPYGASKCALNHIMVRLGLEYQDVLDVKLLAPGPTRTGMGGDSVKWEEIPEAMDVQTVAEGLVERIEEQNVEGESLKLRDWSGKVFDW